MAKNISTAFIVGFISSIILWITSGYFSFAFIFFTLFSTICTGYCYIVLKIGKATDTDKEELKRVTQRDGKVYVGASLISLGLLAFGLPYTWLFYLIMFAVCEYLVRLIKEDLRKGA